MRSLIVCVFILAFVGDSLCGRLRRQAPPSAGSFGAAPKGVGPDMKGPPEDITTQDSTKIDSLDSAKGVMLNDVQNQAAMGMPVDTKKIDAILTKAFQPAAAP